MTDFSRETFISPLEMGDQKLGLKFLRVVDFALRFVIIIESMNFKIRFY
jgi:hypothetical protein